MYSSVTVALVLPNKAQYEGQEIYNQDTEVILQKDAPILYEHDESMVIGKVLDVFKKADGLYAVLAIYEEHKDKLSCDERLCEGRDLWSVGAEYYNNVLTIHEISLTKSPYFPETAQNFEIRLNKQKEVKEKEGDKEKLQKRFMVKVEACGCGKPIRPTENKEKGIITSMMVKAQDLETVLVTVEELSKKVADLEVKVEEVKAALAELTARLEKVEAATEDVPREMEAHKKYMQELSAEIDKTLVQQIAALSDVIKQFAPTISKLSKNI